MSSATNPMRVFFCVRACVELLFRVLVLVCVALRRARRWCGVLSTLRVWKRERRGGGGHATHEAYQGHPCGRGNSTTSDA